MRLEFKTGKTEIKNADTAVFIFEDDGAELEERADLAPYKNLISPLLKEGSYKASPSARLPLKKGDGWLFLVGLGPSRKLGPNRWLEAAATAAQMARARGRRALNLVLPPLAASSISPADELELAALGAQLALYQNGQYKSEPEPAPALQSLTFTLAGLKDGRAIVDRAAVTAEAVGLARRLGDCPPNLMYPQSFVDEAWPLAKSLKLKAQVLDEKGLARKNMNLILAVGAGSARPPRLLSLEYRGAAAGRRPTVLVGKGVTFDSGGLCLKPSANLEGMKTDMAGAATVLAVILAAARLKLPLNLTALMPLAENMPDGGGFRAGDVIRSHSGRTVEITNTDAEGRLILADALSLAGQAKPESIIDVATLTGACAVALGDRCAGLFCNDGALRKGLLDSASAMGENIWPLPLLDDYEDLLKSESADLVNAPGLPRGGAINAALFLRRFVPPQTPWAHLDIAGPGRTGKARPGSPAGASGFAVRSLLRYLSREAS
jgi:leucyl aminopeptidase